NHGPTVGGIRLAAIRGQLLVISRSNGSVGQRGRRYLERSTNVQVGLDREIGQAVVVGNRDGLVIRTLVVPQILQAVVAAAVPIDADVPTAVGHVQRVIAIIVGVHISLIIGAVVGIGAHADPGDGIAEIILDRAADVIGGEDGGEILKQGLAGIDIGVNGYL